MITMADLKQWSQWVGHKDKVPKNPNNGQNASSINPTTWGTAARAWSAKNQYRWDGIGFVFTIDSGVVGVDLDKCFERDDLGVRHLKPWARDVVQCLDSYTEVSPSGNGLHILCKGTIPFSIKKDKIEMYNEARYFTVTGNIYGPVGIELGYCSGGIEERPNELLAIHAVFADDHNHEPHEEHENKQYPSGNTSQESIRAALAVLPVHMSYYEWLTVCMAVHDAFPDQEGVSLIEQWSPGYKGEVSGKFRSFDRTAKNGVSIASLFHLAKQHGYQPAKKIVKAGQRKMSHAEIQKRLAAA